MIVENQIGIKASSFTASLNLDARYLQEFESGNFLYLQRKPNTDQVVYDLEVVEHYQVRHDNYYYQCIWGLILNN